MPSFFQQVFSSYYNRLLQFGHSGNTGTPTNVTNIEAGDGVSTALGLSDDVLFVRPQNDDTQTAFGVYTNSGDVVFRVDTLNTKILTGTSGISVNTQYAYFGVSSTQGLSAVAGTHYLIPFGNILFSSGSAVAFGTGGDPLTSYDISANDNGDDIAMCLWYVPDDITVDAVHLLVGGSAATGDTVNIHLLSFDIDKGAGAGKGDLSNGVVVAGGDDIASLGYENIIYQTTSPSTADVDAGKVILATFESAGTNSDYAINMTVKYHIRSSA